MRIDLNCDLGEGCGSDAELMPFITSANVACGGHAGDEETMLRTVELATEHGVAIGAHPGYEDRKNFGRIALNIEAADLRDMIRLQLERLLNITERLNVRVEHVKPHGALYNQAADNSELAALIAGTIADFDRNLILVGLSGSCSVSEAERAGLRTAREAFGDRRYDSRGRLVSRTVAGAVINDQEVAAAQVLDMVQYGRVCSVDGEMVHVPAETICVHGDSPNAVAMAKRINAALLDAGVTIERLNG